jgi:hypothetical protein
MLPMTARETVLGSRRLEDNVLAKLPLVTKLVEQSFNCVARTWGVVNEMWLYLAYDRETAALIRKTSSELNDALEPLDD